MSITPKSTPNPAQCILAFAQFLSFPRDVEDNKEIDCGKADHARASDRRRAKSFGSSEAIVMRNAAVNVTELVIPDSGHWLMEEQPAATIAAIRAFLNQKNDNAKP